MGHNKYQNLITSILENVGGKDNIASCVHCATRLRFQLKDKNLADTEKLAAIDKVSGSLWVGDQLHVVIGPEVGEVYSALCNEAKLEYSEGIEENLDKPKKKFSIKKGLNGMMEAIMACVVPAISLFVAIGLFAAIQSLFGPDGVVHLMSAESGLYKLLNWAQSALQYFTPIIIAYTASKHFGCNTVASIAIISVLLYGETVSAISTGTFSLFGIAPIAYTLNGQLIPPIIMCWIQARLEKGIKKIIPPVLQFTFVNFLLLVIMVPITMYILTPFGMLIGIVVSLPIKLISGICPPLVPTLIGLLWIPMVSVGIHVGLGALFMSDFFVVGVNYSLMPVSYSLAFIGAVTDLAIMLKAKKDGELKKLAANGVISHLVGGVAEPSIYSIYLKRPTTMISICLGLAATGFYMGITGVGVYALSSTNFLSVMGFLAGSVDNLKRAIPGIVIGCVVSFVSVMILGVKEKGKKA